MIILALPTVLGDRRRSAGPARGSGGLLRVLQTAWHVDQQGLLRMVGVCPPGLQDPRVFRGESRGSSCVCVRTAVTNQVTNAAGLPVARRSHGGKGARARRPQPVRHARTGYRCFPSLRDFKSCRSRGYCDAEDAAMPLIALWDSQPGRHSVIRATPARLVATLFSVAMPRYVR